MTTETTTTTKTLDEQVAEFAALVARNTSLPVERAALAIRRVMNAYGLSVEEIRNAHVNSPAGREFVVAVQPEPVPTGAARCPNCFDTDTIFRRAPDGRMLCRKCTEGTI